LAADGVTGKLGTITRDDGTKQVTLGGMPLYLYSGDSHAGDVTGQAVGGSWWAVSPDGTKVTGAPAAVPGY
jgi:predicted lipoprotein with Yx(FWY)xxD motif